MKFNIKKQIFGLLCLVALQQSNGQIIFHEDFGQSTTRKSSQYIPQAGKDLSLEKSPYSCTSYYKAALELYTTENMPNCNGTNLENYNTWLKNISDGYYVVIDPMFLESSLGSTGNWWQKIEDHTPNDVNGAVLVLNAGKITNQFYRRAVNLKRDTSYKVSYYVMSNASNPNSSVLSATKIEIQNITTEKSLGSSPRISVIEHNKWEKKEYTFRTPSSTECSTNMAISIRNDYPILVGNDIYLDDIVLEEVIDKDAPIIDCDNENNNFDDLIKAVDDEYTFTAKGGVYPITANDELNKVKGNFIFTEANKNATIGVVDQWPVGFSINTNGQFVIAPNTAQPAAPLVYKICNLLGVCSSAKITLHKDTGIPFLGKQDAYYWNNSTQQIFNILENDIFNGGKEGEGFIFSGPNQNMTISIKNSWPSGITLNSSGQIVIAKGVEKPKNAIFYTLCNMVGECQDVQVTFLGDEGDFYPGSITTTGETCYNGSITVNNVEKANYLLYLMSYNWQASIDNGATWKDFGELSEDENPEAGGESSLGDVIIKKGDLITINGLKKPILIRRQAKTIGLSRYAYTSPVLVKPTEENTISLPDENNSFAVEKGKSFTFPTFSTKFPSKITILDANGNEVQNTISNLQKGQYSYTIKATTTTGAPRIGCETFTTVQLIVYDLEDCTTVTKKIFATEAVSWTSGASGVANKENAVSGNRANYATITGGLVILGIGTVGIDLYFTKLSDPNNPNSPRVLYSPSELKGKKITIKLGEQYSGLKLAGGLSVVGRKTNSQVTAGNITILNSSNSGSFKAVKGGLLDLLKGDNVFEFSFTPKDGSGKDVEFNGVRVQLGSLLGVADLATVFHAYIEEEEKTTDPNFVPGGDILVTPPSSLIYPTVQTDVDGTKLTGIKNVNIKLNEFTHDVTWGNRTAVLNVATSLSSVVHPYYAVDDNYDSYTLFNATAGVLNKQFLRTHLRQQARPGDQVQITLAYPNMNILNLSLLQLGNFKIVYYLGDSKVGEERLEKFRVLDIGLFNFKDKRRAVISRPITIPFDSFEIEQFNTVNVNLGDGLHIHDIRIAPMMLFEGQNDSKDVTTICAADFLAIQNPDYCTTYDISFAKVIEYGDAYKNEDETPLLDADGNPIKTITKVEDIPNSALQFSHYGANLMYYSIDRLYTEYENEGIILVKVQTKRQGTNYGNPQYLRVKLKNCNAAIVNPIIKQSSGL
ncbi:hypothetical protein [Empedobacter brevis]|uniref:hypothetical protein n=1 Tax=Empedobacter brevis TaxID=247 RepID=UPI0039B0BE08